MGSAPVPSPLSNPLLSQKEKTVGLEVGMQQCKSMSYILFWWQQALFICMRGFHSLEMIYYVIYCKVAGSQD
ncbi:unnamed protein product [Cuscuta campestris]|uniref:Uncharacterized protein n=1 Tax=Cuscuta campestris TaxID=132261 RepID=A0A484L5P3_9ASTE|nr:unnamed protein product [Cuscuta campestris]